MDEEKDAQELVRGLKSIHVRLPLHQRVLRRRLLASHSYKLMLPYRILGAVRVALQNIQASTEALHVNVGAFTVVAGVAVVGLVMLQPPSTSSQAHHLAITAARQVRTMSADKIARISRGYGDLRECLEEAIRSETLHIATGAELHTLLDLAHKKGRDLSRTYITYTNQHGNRIIIALNTQKEPLYAVDVDTLPKKSELKSYGR